MYRTRQKPIHRTEHRPYPRSVRADSNRTNLLQDPVINTKQGFHQSFLHEGFQWEGRPSGDAIDGKGDTWNRIESIQLLNPTMLDHGIPAFHADELLD